MLHTAADLSYVASKLTVAPWSEGYDKLKNSGYLMQGYVPTPQEVLGRMDQELGSKFRNGGITILISIKTLPLLISWHFVETGR